MRLNKRPIQFYYIRKNDDNFLLHGVAVGQSRNLPPTPIFKAPRSFEWARRFSTVENAIKCATESHITGVSVIDKFGHVIYMGDIRRQTARLLENIGALLKDGGATMNDIRYFIVYLRDFSDREVVESFLSNAYPTIPHVLVHAKVCRPEWLVEMECIAERSKD